MSHEVVECRATSQLASRVRNTIISRGRQRALKIVALRVGLLEAFLASFTQLDLSTPFALQDLAGGDSSSGIWV